MERLREASAASGPGRPWTHDARAADTRLHGLIAASCGNRRLTAEIERCATLWRALRNVSQRLDVESSHAHAAVTLVEHLEIVRALRASDADAAAGSMDRHIRSAGRILESVMFGAKEGAEGNADPRVPGESARI